jgi:hypothetical protein
MGDYMPTKLWSEYFKGRDYWIEIFKPQHEDTIQNASEINRISIKVVRNLFMSLNHIFLCAVLRIIH